MSEKLPPKPMWWKNTYFWIAGILFLIGIWGLIAGQEAIRDPGQRREDWIQFIYFGAAVVMFLNGWISHKQTVQHYEEAVESGPQPRNPERSGDSDSDSEE